MSRATIQQLYAMIRLSGGSYVSNIEHRETTEWATGERRVEFRVTSENLSPGEMDRMGFVIREALDRVRPAGIQFIVAIVPAEDKRYPPPPQSTSPKPEPVPLASRNRFAAVVEELTESPPGELEAPIADLSSELVDLAPNGRLRCLKCTCEAFEPNVVELPDGRPDVKVICRGCPQPMLLSIAHIPDGLDVLVTRPYRCWRCNRKSEVTMSISELNLYCSGCRQLTLHERQGGEAYDLDVNKWRDALDAAEGGISTKTQWKDAIARAEARGVDFDVEWGGDESKMVDGVSAVIDATTKRIASIMAVPEEVLKPEAVNKPTRVFSGARAYLTINGEKIAMSDVSALEVSEEPGKYAAIIGRNDFLAEGASLTMTFTAVDDTKDRTKEILSALGIIDPDGMRQRVLASLGLGDMEESRVVEMYRIALGLQPFTTYASNQYRSSIESGRGERDAIRRTGRTTFGLLRALAKCTIQNSRFLYVTAGNYAADREIIKMATGMRNRVNQTMPRTIRRLSDAEKPPVEENTDVVVYTDHRALDLGY